MSSLEELEQWIAAPEAELTIVWQEATAAWALAAGADRDVAEYRAEFCGHTACSVRSARPRYSRARVSTGRTRRLTTSPPARQEFMRVLYARRSANRAGLVGTCSRRDGDR